MRVRPPAARPRDMNGCHQPAAPIRLLLRRQRLIDVAQADAARDFVGGGAPDLEAEVDDTVVASNPGMDLGALGRHLRRLEDDRTPRAHGRDCRAPAWHSAEQRGAIPAQRLMRDELCAPPRTRALHRQQRRERAKPHDQLVIRSANMTQRNGVLEVHVFRMENVLSIHPHVGDCCEPAEHQTLRRTRRR